MEIDWELCLHNGGQKELFESPARFKIIACGTRWGKSTVSANKVINYGLDNPKATIWWTAPTFEISEVGKETIFKTANGIDLFLRENKVRKILPMITQSQIQFKSADNPVSLLAKGDIDLLIVDEPAQIPDEVWHRYLRRTILDHCGEAWFPGTPKGKNWFYENFLLGQDSSYPEFASFHHPTWDNPLLDKQEIELIKRTTPELIFRQEYGAEFLEDASSVFRNIDLCAIGKLEKPKPGKRYIIGSDPAKYRDFWVNIVGEADRPNVIAIQRSNKLDWGFQKQRLFLLAKEYNNAHVLIDSTGVGDPLYEDLSRIGLNINPYHFTAESKRQIIENLALMIEQTLITYPPIPEVLNELKAFEYSLTSGRNLKYGASTGKFDDCVIALALYAWMVRPESFIDMSLLTGFGKRELATTTMDGF